MDGSDLGPAIRALAEGQKVFDSRYTLMKIVGQSPTSVIWLAWDEKQDRDVALKFLPEMAKEDASALAILKREVFKLQELKNPLLIPIFAVEDEGKVVAIVTEYIEGGTLSELRAQKKSQVYSPPELADWLQQLCGLLEFAHSEAQLAHGTLKPSNLIVSLKGTLRVSDFAIERHVTAFVTRVREGRTAAPAPAEVPVALEAEAAPAGPSKLMIALGVMVLFIAALLGWVFSGGKKTDQANNTVTRTNIVTTTNMSADVTKALKDAEAKRIAAEAETRRLLASVEKSKQDEAKRVANAEKARKEAEAKQLATAAELKRLEAAMEAARKTGGTQLSPEMLAKQKETEAKAKLLQDELNKLKEAEAKRMASAEKEKKDNAAKSADLGRKQADAAKMAAANAEKVREMNIAKAKADEDERQRMLADIAQKEAEAKKMQVAKLADRKSVV